MFNSHNPIILPFFILLRIFLLFFILLNEDYNTCLNNLVTICGKKIKSILTSCRRWWLSDWNTCSAVYSVVVFYVRVNIVTLVTSNVPYTLIHLYICILGNTYIAWFIVSVLEILVKLCYCDFLFLNMCLMFYPLILYSKSVQTLRCISSLKSR